MQKDLAKDRAAINAIKRENRQAQQSAQTARQRSNNFQASQATYMNTFRSGDSFYISANAISGMISQGSQAGQQFSQASGAIATTQAQALATKMQTYQQMDQTALNSIINTSQQATQWVGDLTQTMTQLSTQEQQSMHWSTA